MSDLLSFFVKLFDTDGFPARWHCGTAWTQPLGWLHIASDVLIFGAYATIPGVLALFLSRGKIPRFPLIGWFFVSFILSCGLTHLVDAIIFWQPVYRFSGLMKAVTATVSWITAIALIRIVPQVLALPAIRQENVQLRSALEQSSREAQQLGKVRDELEARGSDLTVRARRLQAAAHGAGCLSMQWELGSGRAVWEVGAERAMERAGLAFEKWTGWRDVIAESGMELLNAAEQAAVRGNGIIDVYVPVRNTPLMAHVRGSLDPVVKGYPTTFTGMMCLVNPQR